jgi:hypothetical protein
MLMALKRGWVELYQGAPPSACLDTNAAARRRAGANLSMRMGNVWACGSLVAGHWLQLDIFAG